MERAQRPPHGDGELPPGNPTVAGANDHDTDARGFVETEARAEAAVGEPAPWREDSSPVERLRAWVRADPPVALATTLGVGLAIGFVLRRTVLLATWELMEVTRG